MIVAMAGDKGSWVMVFTGLARMILHSRELRRKMLFQLLIVLLVIVIFGAWPLADWLGENIWLFLVWWGVSMLYGGMVILLAVYDMLAVIREEREESEKLEDD